jgi:2-dehydropantoate 2-reductase
MRVLMVGAGALGGFFGGCMVQAGRDVTFLVRSRRADQLSRDGLQIIRPAGNFSVPARVLLAGTPTDPFDLVLLALKSYSLDEAMAQFAPAVGPQTTILPVINGMAHLQSLSARFGTDRVLGGMALISATLDAEGRVVQLLPNDELVYGELNGQLGERTAALSRVFDGAGFNARTSEAIMQEMWEQWTLLATNAGMTCLMRASIGDIIATPRGSTAIMQLFHECAAVAEASGHKPRSPFVDFCMGLLTQVGSPLKASLLRDIERGAPTEGEHVLGDMVARARNMNVKTPLLDLAHTHVAAYEIARKRVAVDPS